MPGTKHAAAYWANNMMLLKQSASYRLLFALAGSVLASFITFAASPLALQILTEAQFAHLAIWAIFLIFVQLLDFGYSQLTIKMCSQEKDLKSKIKIIENNNQIIFIFLLASIFIGIFIPIPIGGIYDSFNSTEWELFKISIILNLKIVFNQNAMIAINSQFDYVKNQIYIAAFRFIFPIFLYFYSNKLEIVFIYHIITTIIFIIYTDRIIGIDTRNSIQLKKSINALKSGFSYSFAFYISASMAIFLSVFDRIIASKLLETNDFVLYAATFSLAAAVNIVVLPFYRIFVGRMGAIGRIYNQKNALRISSIQSYICLFSITFLCLYSEYLISIFGINYPIDFTMLVIISLSLWGAANGWIIATEILLSVKPTLQGYLILSALIFYTIYLLFQQDVTIYDISIVWVFHGLIQTFICPIWMSSYQAKKRYKIWIYLVVFFPLFVTGLICAILYWIGLQNKMYSIVAFFTLFTGWAFVMARSSTIKKAF